MVACSEHDYGESASTVITNPSVSTVGATSAVVTATASGPAIIKRGICYSTEANPTIDSKSLTASTADMSMVLRNLKEGTTYHLRTFILTNDDVTYSDDVAFNTLNTISQTDLDTWQAPDFVDDYRDFSSWDKRYTWNLANVHDPTVMKADDGYYYMYTTDAGYGNPQAQHGHFHARRSPDLVTWEYLGATMPEKAPAWVLEKTNEYRAEMGVEPLAEPEYFYWAPSAHKVREGLYRMYYVIGLDNYIKTGKKNTAANFDGSWTERAFIGLMETADPASNIWVDKGMVICSSSDKGATGWTRPNSADYDAYFYFNAIDPAFVITPEGQHWLIYGSWHSGFAAVQLNPETGKTITPLGKPWANSAQELAENGYGKRIWSRGTSRWQGSEAPEIVFHDGYYYMFMAYDGLDIPYNTRVIRSQNVDGPYVNIKGEDGTNGGDAFPIVTHPYRFSNSTGWVGISHCAVFGDDEGNWYYASQQRLPVTAGGNEPNAMMLGGVRRILWDAEGWPMAMPERYAAVPNVPITAEEIVGTWEHIDLGYSKGNMKEAGNMTFGADGKITDGIWKNATWSFDASTNTLTANGVKLKVARECDWEASPRKHTLVYAGINKNSNRTYWGKKK